jgi:hypothetical protein
MRLKSTASRKGRRAKAMHEDVKAAANAYCLRSFGDAFQGGTPRSLTLPSGRLWIVPVLFTRPGYGPVGEAGVLAIEPATLTVLDATPKAEVRAAGVRLAREKRDGIDAAFRRARGT